MSAVTEERDEGEWSSTGTTYFRYFKASADGGFAHGMKFILGPQSYHRMERAGITPTLATDAELAEYADNAFQYDSITGAIIREKTMGGSRTFAFDRVRSSFSNDFNHWAVKTTETFPDGNANVVYTNFAGQVILSVRKAKDDEWYQYYQYDNGGLVIKESKSSAIASVNESLPSLVELKSNAGLIKAYSYYKETHLQSGSVARLLQYEQIQQGEDGKLIILHEYKYTSRSIGVSARYLLAKDICYPSDQDPLFQLLCNVYSYKWEAGSLVYLERTTSYPAVTKEQHGSGESESLTEVYDKFGNRTWLRDASGYITKWSYDLATGATSRRIEDVNTEKMAGAPTNWKTPQGGGKNLITDFVTDLFGRTTEELGPVHEVDIDGVSTKVRRANWTVFCDTRQEYRQAKGYVKRSESGSSATLVGPVEIFFRDLSGRTTDQIKATRVKGRGALSAKDNFPRETWVAWTSMKYAHDSSPAYKRVYTSIPARGTGLRVVNYNQTSFRYDGMHRLVRRQFPGGTIARYTYNAMGWSLTTWLGTSDTGATMKDPAGGSRAGRANNMTLVATREYDAGLSKGDGNMTRLVEHVNDAQQRTTEYRYDFRNRRIAIIGEMNFYSEVMYDNLDKQIRVDEYSSDKNGTLIARRELRFDNRFRIYQRLYFAIDPESGKSGRSFADNFWYDPRSNVIQSQHAGSQALMRTTYDGVNQKLLVLTGGSEKAISAPGLISPSDMLVAKQVEYSYDRAGNTILEISSERSHDATGLGKLTRGEGEKGPEGRASYRALWTDAIGRAQASGDVGTNAGKRYKRPAVVPRRSNSVLVQSSEYDQAGLLYRKTDAQGRIRLFEFDAAGQTIAVVDNYVAGSGKPDENVRVEKKYNGDGNVITQTVRNAITGDQVTQYLYGTALSNSEVARNDLLRTIIYPDDSSQDAGREVFSYNRQGQVKTRHDQRGSIHSLEYDLRGRTSADRLSTLGDEVDGSVRRIEYGYEARGMINRVTSFDQPTEGNVLNEVRSTYNHFSQLATQSQSHAGSSGPNSPVVVYSYTDGENNVLRPTAVNYPAGKTVRYDYGQPKQLSEILNRIDAVGDDTLGTIVKYEWR